jgi:acetoin:2,6-dichlorophenolindophenol oxidoreductase subunit beta
VTTKTDQNTVNFTQAINLALHDALEADDRVFLIGEDIADEEDGGVFKVTAGLSAKYGRERVRSTPIAEEGLIGAAIGAAQAGMRPVAEIMLMGFITLALDSIHNTAAKWRYMSGGRASVPLTIRTHGGAGDTIGAQHNDLLEGWLAASPGLKVVMPSTAADAYGLLMSCIFDDDPCIFIEQSGVSMRQPKSPTPVPGTRVPIGQAKVCRSGTDVSVIGYGAQVLDALQVADGLAGQGIDVEVIDLRTIQPFDHAAIMTSVAKTKRAVVVHEARTRFGPGAEIASQIYEELFSELAAPVERVGAPFTPVPSAAALERAYIPGPVQIEAAVRRTLKDGN